MNQARVGWWPGALIGVLCFWLVIGFSIVPPGHIGWLGITEDPKTYYIAWQYFRASPWQFPITANPDYGLEFAGSVFMADVVPLFAVLFKIFSGWLPSQFQYHGLWLLACYMLQGAAAWKLAELVDAHWPQKILIAILFVFQIPFLSRGTGHLPLMAQGLILLSLYLYLTPRVARVDSRWLGVLVVAATVNAYLLAMCMAFWAASAARRMFQLRGAGGVVKEGAVVAATLVLVLWQVGYFSVGGGVQASAGDYGLYRANILWPIDSNGWSYVWRDFPGGPGDYEGFAFLGLGTLFLVTLAVALLLHEGTNVLAFARRHAWLVGAVLAMSAYALTNRVGVGALDIGFPLPDTLNRAVSVFRASGRFVWPMLYLGVFTAVYFCVRLYGGGAGLLVLLLATVLQVVDTRPGWGPVAHQVEAAAQRPWSTRLTSPFWTEVAPRFKTLRVLPTRNAGPGWADLASYAANHGMATDSAYLARVNNVGMEQARAQGEAAISAGKFEPDTLYVLDEALVSRALLRMDQQRDGLFKVDGLFVLASGLGTQSRLAAPGSAQRVASSDYLPRTAPGLELKVAPGTPGARLLLDGWPQVGAEGVWSEGRYASFFVPRDTRIGSVDLIGSSFLAAGGGLQNHRVRVDDGPWQDPQRVADGLKVQLPPRGGDGAQVGSGSVITLESAQAVSPHELGQGGDRRQLGFVLKAIRFN